MDQVYDYAIIGSGFGGSVAAMRLTEKGYSVLVLEKGKRFTEETYAKTNWQFWKYLWLPALRAHGIMQISILKGVMVLHGAGVGGGSLGYSNVLEVPNDETFATTAWNTPIAWGEALRPHYETAQHMLGVERNNKLWKADNVLREIAEARGMGQTFRATDVGVFLGEAGVTVPDPYFGGAGPERTGCIHCGACMVGCRYNSKNTLPKNYLYFAEKSGAKILAESEVTDVRPSTLDPSTLFSRSGHAFDLGLWTFDLRLAQGRLLSTLDLGPWTLDFGPFDPSNLRLASLAQGFAFDFAPLTTSPGAIKCCSICSL